METLNETACVPARDVGKVWAEWHEHWSPAISEAFAALPYDELMDVEVVKRLYERQAGQRRQIAVLRDGDSGIVGVLPLRWELGWNRIYSWQLLTQMSMPYARFHVLPGYTEAALRVLKRYIACDNVLFHELPRRGGSLSPEMSWVVDLSCSYEELMKRTKYAAEDRRVRKRAAGLELVEDRFEDLPLALEHWAKKWREDGDEHSARSKDDKLLTFQTLALQGRLKTFSLYDGSRFVSMNINILGQDKLYFMVTVHLDEYRQAYPGIRNILATLEWACANGILEYDMLRTTPDYKKKWAHPVPRGYRLVRGPFGSHLLGSALEATGSLISRVRWKLEGKQ